MKHITKKKLSERKKLILILAVSFAALLLASILLAVFLGGDAGEEKPKVDPPSIIEGEAIKNNMAIAYPEVSESSIMLIKVSNKTGSYGLQRPSKDETMMLFYTDSRGETQVYYPDICNLDADFEYSDLYAIEQDDGYKRFTRLSYLCLSLQLAYFEERIPLPEDEILAARMLADFGLNEESASRVSFSYLDADGKEAIRSITIGSEILQGGGYYFMVDDRPYVYSSLSNDYSYALSGFYTFVKAALVAEGLTEDNGQEPYLTTGFYEWINEKHAEAGETVSADSRVVVYTDIIKPIDPSGSQSGVSDDGYIYDGYHLLEIDLKKYSKDESYKRLVDSLVGKKNGVYYDMEDPESENKSHIAVTLTSRGKHIDFSEKSEINYKYTIIEIESIITDDGEITKSGTPVGDNNLVKITYIPVVDGVLITPYFCHAVMDLTDPIFSAETIDLVRGSKIGNIPGGAIPIEIDYTKDNSVLVTAKYIITEVISIYDQKGKEEKTVGEESIVSIRYHYEIDGKLTEEDTIVVDLKSATGEKNENLRKFLIGRSVGKIPYVTVTESDTGKVVKRIITDIISVVDKEGNTFYYETDENGKTLYKKKDADGKVSTHSNLTEFKINASSTVTYSYITEINGVIAGEEITETVDLNFATDPFGLSLTDTLSSMTVGAIESPVAETVKEYYEHLYDFVTYNIARIDYFVTSDLVVAFKFKNASERDPYYGESLYENLLEDERRLYGLNSSACENIVKILGGISLDAESNTADGLFGDETLAVGLTPEIMDKYGLYDYTVYFELPRSLYAYSTVGADGQIDPDALDDYSYYDTLGFTLYFSKEDIDGKRYVASDLYQVVTKIDGENLIFLDFGFTEFWARRNIMLMDYSYIEELDVEFMLDDIKGAYEMELSHKTVYISQENNHGYYTPPEGNYTIFDQVSVAVTPEDINACTPNKLTETIKEKGYTFLSLTELYGGSNVFEENSYDYLGTSNFKELLRLIYFTRYQDVMSEEDQIRVVVPDNLLLRINLKISSSAYRYVYEFYRGDDRRVVVRLYQADSDGNVKTTPVSDFYISTFAFKKLVFGFNSILNGEILEIDDTYFKDEEN